MGNFEKLSVLVIGVIIVMILVVAIYTWTGNPDEAAGPETAFVPTDDVLEVRAVSDTLASNSAPINWDQYDKPAGPPQSIDEVIVKNTDTLETKSTETVDAVDDVESTAVATAAVEETYEIRSNDTLGLISQKFYGTTKYWPQIAERNGLVPERLRVGKQIYIPVIDGLDGTKSTNPAAPKSTARVGGASPGTSYTVRGGETIQQISRTAYGTIERWVDIYVANLEVLSNPRQLSAGTVLRLPE